MKRDEALRPLSREHLGALQTAKRLRESDRIEEATAVFLDFWRSDGSRHFRVEEEVLLPGWYAVAEVDRQGVGRLLEEHLKIRGAALRLESGTASLGEAHKLGKLLHDHVRFEERELFPRVEEDMEGEALAALADAIDEAERAWRDDRFRSPSP